MLQHSSHADHTGRFHHQTRVLEDQAHGAFNRRFADQQHIVYRALHVGQRLGYWHAHGDAVGNRVGHAALHGAALAPRCGHGVCACGTHADHAHIGRKGLGPAAHAGQQRAVAQWHQQGAKVAPRQHLAGDGAFAFGNAGLSTVFHKIPVAVGAEALGFFLGAVKVVAVQAHLGTQRTHALHLVGIGRGGAVHHQRPLPGAAHIGHCLAPVAGSGADQRAARQTIGVLVHEEVRTAALEGSQRVQRFNFERERRHAQCVG